RSVDGITGQCSATSATVLVGTQPKKMWQIFMIKQKRVTSFNSAEGKLWFCRNKSKFFMNNAEKNKPIPK
ncbi:MAG: hypothetical protein ACLFQM_13195, partial [Fidelibacterota bacterium]